MAAVAVVDGLYRIDTPLGDRFASLYLVVGQTSALLYDTGVDGTIPAHVVPALAQLGLSPGDVSTVVISHCDVDHFGGVSDAREAFPRARILAGAADRPAIENYDTYVSDRARGFLREYGWDEDPAVLEWCRSVTREGSLDGDALDGATIDLGGREVSIRSVPGHSTGHTAIDVPFADSVLVSDAVLGASVNLADGTPAFPPTYRYVNDYLATISMLEALGRTRLLTAHYPAFEDEAARTFLRQSREFVESLDGLIVDALSSHDFTLAELLRQLNPIAGSWPAEGTEGALAFPVVGHLERLRDAGRLRRTGERSGVPSWTLA